MSKFQTLCLRLLKGTFHTRPVCIKKVNHLSGDCVQFLGSRSVVADKTTVKENVAGNSHRHYWWQFGPISFCLPLLQEKVHILDQKGSVPN